MTSFFINFRGFEDVEIVIDADHGYEWDTGAHDIDWHFDDDRLADVELTEAEEQLIFEHCANITAIPAARFALDTPQKLGGGDDS